MMGYVWLILVPILLIIVYDYKNRLTKRKSGRFSHEIDNSKEGRDLEGEGNAMQHFSTRKY